MFSRAGACKRSPNLCYKHREFWWALAKTHFAKHASDEESQCGQTIRYLVNYTHLYLSSLHQSAVVILHCDVITDILKMTKDQLNHKRLWCKRFLIWTSRCVDRKLNPSIKSDAIIFISKKACCLYTVCLISHQQTLSDEIAALFRIIIN